MFAARRAQLHHIICDKISESKEKIYELEPILCKEGVTFTTEESAELKYTKGVTGVKYCPYRRLRGRVV